MCPREGWHRATECREKMVPVPGYVLFSLPPKNFAKACTYTFRAGSFAWRERSGRKGALVTRVHV